VREHSGHVLALCGGVGGAKLAYGLARTLAPGDLTIVVNTGDDFEHLGLAISPDIDTVVYTLAELADPQRGWGLAGESWTFMNALRRLGGEDWFQLGDQDLATHVERTRRLAAGETLSQVTAALATSLGVEHAVVPMSDQPVRTIVDTDDGPLPFQHYFVRDRCLPIVTGVRFEGSRSAGLSAAFSEALARPDLSGIVICPSNPYLSIDPILALAGLRAAIARSPAACVAVSPIVGGRAIKGPTTKIMAELGVPTDVGAIATHYRGLIDALVVDDADEGWLADIEALRVRLLATRTVMEDNADRIALAGAVLAFLGTLGPLRERGAADG
jgi:LPPG:FO 2-phospho-L-lactate transferase